jgi:signal transduction histidine kinase
MVLLVAAEIVVSVVLAVWLRRFVDQLLPAHWHIPLLLYLLVVSMLVGIVFTMFLSRLFFMPVKRLRLAMAKVAEGDFSIRLHTKSNSREIQEIYAGFNLMNQELGSMEILQTDFVSNVSHEFKTPLNAIEGYSTLLQDCGNLTPQQQAYVEKIIFNTQRLSTLTGSILLLSKLENQQIPTGQTRFSLDEQIRQTIVFLEPAWSAKEIELDVEMEEVEYFGNELLMHHVWSNLLSNAVKFSPQGGLVRIGLEKGRKDIRFFIRDNGPGIPEEAMNHIFDRFYQADSSHKQEGNGLGLALVKRILQLENGKITAENCPQGGARFTVYLNKN